MRLTGGDPQAHRIRKQPSKRAAVFSFQEGGDDAIFANHARKTCNT